MGEGSFEWKAEGKGEKKLIIEPIVTSGRRFSGILTTTFEIAIT